MNEEHTQHLLSRYPVLYTQHDWSLRDTAMCWGFECGDGWFNLIDALSQKLEWLNRTGAVRVEAVQVKEKFGGLRFYSVIKDASDDFPSEMICDLSDHAENYSYQVCEECGERGREREGGWIRTLCDKHAKERGYELDELDATNGGEE